MLVSIPVNLTVSFDFHCLDVVAVIYAEKATLVSVRIYIQDQTNNLTKLMALILGQCYEN